MNRVLVALLVLCAVSGCTRGDAQQKAAAPAAVPVSDVQHTFRIDDDGVRKHELTRFRSGRTEGLEFGFTYDSKEYNWGKIDLQFDGSYLYWLTQQTLVGVNPNGTPFFRVFNETDTAIQAASAPDIKFQASAFYSKTVFGIDTFKTGLTLHYIGSELDFTNSANNTNPNAALNFPNYVHLIGSWTTLDWQISYKFGQPTEITPAAPKAG